MRLRSRLALFFALIALVPLGLVVPLALGNVRRTLSNELDTRIAGALTAARASLDQAGRDAGSAVSELARSEAVDEVVSSLGEHAPPSRLSRVAGELMESRALTVLSLFDEGGRTVSSGHLPARLGDPDPALFAITREAGAGARPVLVEVRAERGLREIPALVAAARTRGGEPRLWVVGGVLLDRALAEHLAKLTGAEVEIVARGETVAEAGERQEPAVRRELPLSSEVAVVFRFGKAGLLGVERGLVEAVVALAGLGLALAIAAGLLAARRITRPVEALTEGARKVAAGDLHFQVQERASGELGALIGSFNRMTSELDRTTEQLLASERVAAWQEVAKRLAHEIKNPLTPIQMSLETLIAAKQEQHPRFGQLFDESAGAVLEEVERLRRIVDEFSRFARLPRPKLERLELGPLASQLLSLYSGGAPGVRHHLAIEPGVFAMADRDQLTQVLMNLVKNAEEAMPSGGDVFVRVRADGETAQLEVEDSGPGFTPEAAAHVFEPYFTTKAAGTGLGLSIAARICQDHGGKLELDPRPGEGARFRISLPRVSP